MSRPGVKRVSSTVPFLEVDTLSTELPGPVSFDETDNRDKLFSKELNEWTVIIVELFLDIFNGILSRIVTQVFVCTGDFVLAN